jgi:hypothetical protein
MSAYFCVAVLGLQEIEEGQVRGGAGHQGGLLSFELLQHRHRRVELLAAEEVVGLRDLELGADPREAVVVQLLDHPVVPGHGSGLYDRGDQVGRVHDEACGLPLAALNVLPQRVVTLHELAPVRRPGGSLAELQLLLVHVLQADLLDVEQLQEAALHLLRLLLSLPLTVFLARWRHEGVVAQDQVEARLEVQVLGSVPHQVLVRVDRVWELVHLEERVPDVAHDLESDGLHVVRDLVEGHAVHLDRRSPLLLLEVDVPHVDAEAAAKGVLLILHDLGVDLQGLVVVVVGLVLNGEVEADGVGQVHVQLVEEIVLLPQPAQLALLLAGFLALL